MKAIKIYTQEGKYFMEDLDTNVTTELTNVTKDGISFILPENSANRNFCSIKRAEKGVTLEYKETKTFDTSTPKTPKESWTNYLTEEERKIYGDLKTKCEARMNKTKTENQFKEMAKNFTKEELLAMLGMTKEAKA